VRGTAVAQGQYSSSASVGEKPLAVMELNANTGIGYTYAGYYFTTFPSPKPPGSENDPTSSGTAVGTAWATYTDGSTTKVRGAAFTTGSVKFNRPIIDGILDTSIPSLAYVDEPDLNFEETFSIVNCLKGDRPRPGIVRMTTTGAVQVVPNARGRLYPASREHKFKYWRAKDLNQSNPFVYYSRDFLANKVKITVQNYIGVPRNYQIQVLLAGSSTWTTIWTQANGAFPVTGEFKIYYYDGAWTATPNTTKIQAIGAQQITNAVKIRGLRMLVTSMNSFYNGFATPNPTTQLPPANSVPLDTYPSVVQNDKVPLEVIEISARLSLDVSESIMNFDTVGALSEEDSALPVGSLIANDAKLSLENYDHTLSFRDINSPLYGWEPKRSHLDMYFATTTPSNQIEVNRVFLGIMTDVQSNGDNVDITAMDNSNILQNVRVKNFVTLNKSLVSIISMLLDYAGVSGWTAHFSNSTVPITSGIVHAENPMIPYYHAHDQTVFEAISDIAEAYQMSASFDADGILHMYSKEYIFDRAASPVYTLTYNDSGTTLANIKGMEVTPGKPINDITVAYDQKYIRKAVSPSSLGEPMWDAQLQPAVSKAWDADTEWLAAAPLVKTLDNVQGVSAEGTMTIDQEGGDGLVPEGYLLIDGEVIAYNAKQYQMKIGSAYTTKWITSQGEYNYWRDKTTTGGRMFFTGVLRIPKGGRARFNSTLATHTVDTTGTWPYTSTFNSYKWSAPLNGTRLTAATGEATWNYRGGSVYNVRGSLANSTAPTRNGSESCIRLTGPTEIEFSNYGATALNPISACNNTGHAYLTYTPVKTDGKRVIPMRVGAGVRILGRVDGSRKSISALGTLGAGGISMFMNFNSSGMQGWALEVRATVEQPTNNMTLFQIINSVWHVRKQATVICNVWPPDQNTSVDTTDISWNHLDLAWFPANHATPGRFVGYLDGKAWVSYTPTVAVAYTAWYGPYVRGDSYMDTDYIWWSDRSDPNDIDGYGLSNDSDPSDYTLEDTINGAGGPPMWWEDGADKIFKKGSWSDQTYTFGLQEFGPIAHAVVVKDIEFDDGPYLNPYVSISNKSEVIVPESDLGPFGGRIVMVNARRRAVSVAGERAPLSVSGYKIESDESEYTLDEHIRSGAQNSGILGSAAEYKANASRAIHGYIPIEIKTDIIQERGMAAKVLDWVVDNCTIDCDIISAEVFGNPLVEPGDRVRVIHPDHGYTASNKFVVMRVENKWNKGLESTLVLRRIQ
jgi:hypothetical protein